MKLLKKYTKRYLLNQEICKKLESNNHQYKLVDKKFLLKKKLIGGKPRYVPEFKNQKLVYKYLIYRLKLKLTYELRKDSKFKFKDNDIIPNIYECFEIVRFKTPGNKIEYLIYDYSERYYVPLRDKLEEFLVALNDAKVINISSLEGSKRNLLLQLRNSHALNSFVYNEFRTPPAHFINVKNGVFDLKNKKMVDRQEASKYHFISKIEHNLYPTNKVNRLFYENINRMFDNWTENDEEKKTLLQQISFAMIDGNGRKKSVIFQSPGGGGKSTFIKINSLIVGAGKVLNCGMYELNNDNLVGQLSPSIKFMQGDDANTNARMNDKALSRMKSLNDGGEFMVDVKFEPSKNVYFNGLIIQNTNTDIGFYENNPALADRIILFEWTPRNFRADKSSLEISLEDMLGKFNPRVEPNTEFLEAYLSYILYNTEWFTEYDIPETVKKSTALLLESNDNVEAYVTFMKEQDLLILPYINLNMEHKRYELWLNDNNAGAKPLKSRKFTTQLKDKLEKCGYLSDKLDDKTKETRLRATSFNLLDYNNNVFNQASSYEVEINKKRNYTFVVNEDNLITDDDIKNFYYEVEKDSLDLANPKMLQILYYKVYELHDPELTTKYGDKL